MNESNQTTNPASETDSQAKMNVLIAYGLMALGLFLGFPWVIGGIWALIKRDDAKGTIFESHYKNAITTFWWGLGLSILGVILMTVVIGYIMLIGVWIWCVYRILKGFAKITSNQPYSN